MNTAQILYEQYKVLPKWVKNELLQLITQENNEYIKTRLGRKIAEEETERNDWSKISIKGIASAYNDNEPEY